MFSFILGAAAAIMLFNPTVVCDTLDIHTLEQGYHCSLPAGVLVEMDNILYGPDYSEVEDE